MKVVITGGLGFLGQRLARALLQRETLTGASGGQEGIDRLILFDAAVPERPPAGLDDARVSLVAGDVADGATVRALVAGDSLSVFHFASVVSAGAEQDFDLALAVNLTGGLNVLDACRAAPGLPRLVFTSSIAVYGGSALPETVGDETKITPQGTYGVTKVINEHLVADYTRKGWLDGRGGRPPTVIVRPGKPNKAASGFASGLFREPLAGLDHALPVSRETRIVLGGYRTIVGEPRGAARAAGRGARRRPHHQPALLLGDGGRDGGGIGARGRGPQARRRHRRARCGGAAARRLLAGLRPGRPGGGPRPAREPAAGRGGAPVHRGLRGRVALPLIHRFLLYNKVLREIGLVLQFLVFGRRPAPARTMTPTGHPG